MKICNLKVENNLFISPINKIKSRNVGILTINNEKRILKIEDINDGNKIGGIPAIIPVCGAGRGNAVFVLEFFHS